MVNLFTLVVQSKKIKFSGKVKTFHDGVLENVDIAVDGVNTTRTDENGVY